MDSLPPTHDEKQPGGLSDLYAAQHPADEVFPPVTSMLGEQVRQIGLHHVSQRFLALSDRAKRRELTLVERAEVNQAHRALDTLQRMAPVGELQPARVKGQLALPSGL